MIFEGWAESALGWLLGAPVPSARRQQLYHDTNQARAEAARRGWLSWVSAYQRIYDGSMLGISPYDYQRVWVWRPEWDRLPVAVNVKDMAPEMNVNGLLWKPWLGSEEPDVPLALPGKSP